MEITCPSGLRGEIRKMKMRELALLTDEKLIRTGQLMTEMVKNCWVRTIDAGPYNLPAPSPQPLPWDQLLQADKMYTFKEIRVTTFGPSFEWEVQCPHNMCKHRFLWDVDLSTLDVERPPQYALDHVKSGSYLTTTVDGKKVEFRTLRGADDRRLLHFIQKLELPLLTAGYICRIVSVEGIDESDAESLREWLDDLDLEVGQEFQDTMDDAEPSIGLRTDIECPRCGEDWPAMIPLAQSFSRKTVKSSKGSTKSTATSTEPSSTSPGNTAKLAAQT